MNRNFDLVIAGAGIMGMACALEEARHGKSVGVFDPEDTQAQGSFASAGILVTRDAHVFLSPFREFYVRSIRQYPEWLEGVSALASASIKQHRVGDYLVYDLSDPVGQIRFEAKLNQLEREHSREYTVTDTLPTALAGVCPAKSVRVLHFPSESYVQNRDLLLGLRQACQKVGVVFHKGAPTAPWNYSEGSTLLPFIEMQWNARQVLIAAGAWSVRVLEGLGIAAPLMGVKGQMARIPKFHTSESMIHFNDDMYLVPRGDTLIVGATTEPGNWQEGFDETGDAYINSRLRKYLPDVSRDRLESWSGIRPRPKDRLPWMGWVDAERGWAICTGHYKTGISMAPLAAHCMSKLLRGEKVPFDLAPFNPWRRQGLSRLKG